MRYCTHVSCQNKVFVIMPGLPPVKREVDNRWIRAVLWFGDLPIDDKNPSHRKLFSPSLLNWQFRLWQIFIQFHLQWGWADKFRCSPSASKFSKMREKKILWFSYLSLHESCSLFPELLHCITCMHIILVKKILSQKDIIFLYFCLTR